MLWKTGILVLLLTFLNIPITSAQITEDFEGWPGAPGEGLTNEGWGVLMGYIYDGDYRSPNYCAMLYPSSSGTEYFYSPSLSNGIGTVSFYAKNLTTEELIFRVETSTNYWASTNQVLLTNSSSALWTKHTVNLRIYTNAQLRIRNQSPDDYLLIDDITIELPISFVVIDNITLVPNPPIADVPVNITCTIEPQAGANDVDATLYYWSDPSLTNQIPMNMATDLLHYATHYPVPALPDAGARVYYYIRTAFNGTTTNNIQLTSPDNAPASYYFYKVSGPVPATIYTNVTVVGPPSTNLDITGDYRWQGVIFKGSYINPAFSIRCNSTNWGDTDQIGTNIPMTGILDLSTNIRITATLTNHLLFTLSETNRRYWIQDCQYVNFDNLGLPQAVINNHSLSEGWYIYQGRVTTGSMTQKVYRGTGLSCILESTNYNSYLRSPQMTNGLSVLSFRYRNFLEEGRTSATFQVQQSITGTDNWQVVTQFVQVLSPDYLFASVTFVDTNVQYCRIMNTTSSSNTPICVDEVTLTAPAGRVTMYNYSVPLTAGDGEPVPVSVAFTSTAFSVSGPPTNLIGRVHWKSAEDTAYGSRELTIVSNRFVGAIPPLYEGTVDFYFSCTYDCFGTQTAFLYPTNSFTYSVGLSSNRFQPFDDWTEAQAGFGDHEKNGWMIHNGIVVDWGSGLIDGFFDAYTSISMGDESYLRSPKLSGVESIQFASTVHAADFMSLLRVEASSDGTSSWSTVGYVTNNISEWFITNTLSLTTYEDVYLRFACEAIASDSAYPGLENIKLPPPSADVVMTNFRYDPGYPILGETINVYCDIYSKSTNTLAYNIVPWLYTRSGGGSWTSNFMSRVGTNTYMASFKMPSVPLLLEFYVRCDFSGYYYVDPAFYTKRSPHFLPFIDATNSMPTNFFEYIPRRWQSSHENITVNVSTGTVEDIHLVQDFIWEGFMSVPRSATNLLVSFSGFGEYLGSSYSSATNIWGNSDQDMDFTETPLTGIATQGGGQISVNMDTSSLSRILFRYDTSNQTYEIRRAVYQNFNRFTADLNYFNYSLDFGEINTRSNYFEIWPTNVIYVTPPTIDQEWFNELWWIPRGATTNYYNALTVSDKGWWIFNTWVQYEMGKFPTINPNNFNATNYHNYAGRIGTNGYVVPQWDTLTDGLKTFSFKARSYCPTSHVPLVYTSQPLTNYIVHVEWHSTDTSPGEARFMLMAPYYSHTNYYAHEIIRTNSGLWSAPDRYSKITTRTRGITRTDITGSTFNNRNFTFTNSIFHTTMQVSGLPNETYLSAWQGAPEVDPDQKWETTIPFTSNTFAIACTEASVVIDYVLARYADYHSFGNFTTGYSNYVHGGWSYTNAAVNSGWLNLNSNTNSYIVSPDLGHYSGGFTTIWGVVRTPVAGLLGTLDIEGSVDGISWSNIATITAITNNPTKNINVINTVTSNRWFRMRPANTNRILQIDYIEARAADYFLVDNFTNGPSANFSTPAGYWTTTNVARGLTGQYYDGVNFDTLKVTRVDSTVNFTTWGTNIPIAGVSSNNFTVRWTGQIQPKYSQTYYFSVNADDGKRLWVDNQLIIDWWVSGLSDKTGSIALVAGQMYDIKLEYVEYSATASCSLSWRSASQPKEIIPWHQLYTGTPADNWGTYCPGYVGPTADFKVQTYIPPYPYAPPYPSEIDWTNGYSFQISNYNYQTFSPTFNFWNKMFVRIINTSTDTDLIVDDLTMSSWRAKSYVSNGWTVSDGWVASNAAPVKHLLELTRSRSDPSTNQYIELANNSNGIGKVTFDYKVNDINAAFAFEYGLKDTNRVVTNFITPNVADSWLQYELYVNSPSATYARVHHFTDVASNPAAMLSLDKIEVSEYKALDVKVWEVYNALITHTNDIMEFEPGYVPGEDVKTCYLNNDATNDTFGGKAFTNPPLPYIQSARLAEGIGEISFWYRNWDTNLTPVHIQIYAGPNPEAPFPAGWRKLDDIEVAHANYKYYKYSDYLTTNFYVRISTSNNTSYARACIDNIIIAEPLAASLRAINLTPVPYQPLYTDTPHFLLQLGRYRMHPSNVSARLYYNYSTTNNYTNDWGNQSGSSWATGTQFLAFDKTNWSGNNGMSLETTQTLPPTNIDLIVQYYASVRFDGLLASRSSPYESHGIFYSFTNPAHYYPVNLNTNMGGIYTNPYYFVYSCPPRSVFFNELNYMFGHPYDVSNEYVELCGPAGAIIGNWRIQLVDTATNVYQEGRISPPNFALPADANGFGFFVYGDTNMSYTADLTFPTAATATNINDNGGVRLIRSMGAYEYQICYGANALQGLTNAGFQYTTFKGDGEPTPLYLYSQGTNYNDFAWTAALDGWSYDYFYYNTPGSINIGQIFGSSPPWIELINMTYSSTNTSLVFTSTATNDISPVPYYSTNLMSNIWIQITGSTYSYAPLSNVYTQNFNTLPTNSRIYFFKIVTSNW